MLTKSVLPANWRSFRTWDLINLRKELRIASKELEERNDATAADFHLALAELDRHLCPLLAREPTDEEWRESFGVTMSWGRPEAMSRSIAA